MPLTINHSVHALENSKSKNENFLHIRGTFYPERACQNRHLQKISPYHFFFGAQPSESAIVKIVTPEKCRSRSPGVRTGVHMDQLFGTFRAKMLPIKKEKNVVKNFFFGPFPGFLGNEPSYIYIYIQCTRNGALCAWVCVASLKLRGATPNTERSAYTIYYIYIYMAVFGQIKKTAAQCIKFIKYRAR